MDEENQSHTDENGTNDPTSPTIYDENVDILPPYNHYLMNLVNIQVYVEFNL